MLGRFKEYIEGKIPNVRNTTVLVACSGGLDSVVLVYMLRALNFNVAIAHCNFKLRGQESEEDAMFVKSLAEELECTFWLKTFDTAEIADKQKESIQVTARNLRYEWFHSLVKKHQYTAILTAHHLDDSLETFFINMVRGTGLRGLVGIPSNNSNVFRPLLKFTREEIKNYAVSHSINWREDSSNSKTEYLRNAIRHNVVPELIKADKRLYGNFEKTLGHLNSSLKLIEDYVELVSNNVWIKNSFGSELDIEKLKTYPNFDLLLYELLKPYGFTSWDDVIDLVDAQSGKQLFSENYRLIKDRGVLLLVKREDFNKNEKFFIKKSEVFIDTPIQLQLNPIEKIGKQTTTTIYVDADKIEYPLVLRKWREGDVFQPFGMKGKKKLSKFFKDEKLSLVAKENTWLLCSQEKIIWIVGLRADNRFKVTEKTNLILKITHTYPSL